MNNESQMPNRGIYYSCKVCEGILLPKPNDREEDLLLRAYTHQGIPLDTPLPTGLVIMHITAKSTSDLIYEITLGNGKLDLPESNIIKGSGELNHAYTQPNVDYILEKSSRGSKKITWLQDKDKNSLWIKLMLRTGNFKRLLTKSEFREFKKLYEACEEHGARMGRQKRDEPPIEIRKLKRTSKELEEFLQPA